MKKILIALATVLVAAVVVMAILTITVDEGSSGPRVQPVSPTPTRVSPS